MTVGECLTWIILCLGILTYHHSLLHSANTSFRACSLEHSTLFYHILCPWGRFQHQETENALCSFCYSIHITSMKQKSAILNPNRETIFSFLFFFGGKTAQTFKKHLQNLSFEILRKENNIQHQKLSFSLFRKNEVGHWRDLLIHEGNYFLWPTIVTTVRYRSCFPQILVWLFSIALLVFHKPRQAACQFKTPEVYLPNAADSAPPMAGQDECLSLEGFLGVGLYVPTGRRLLSW